MEYEKKDLVKKEDKEIMEFTYFGEQFSNKQVLDILQDIDTKGKELEVGGQTTYQNRFFVLNPVEFPEGSSHKSRQAVFEASVRVDNLKSLLFEYKKTIAEQKLIEIKKLKIKRKIENATDDLDKLEAEVELEMVEIEKRQKEIAHKPPQEERDRHELQRHIGKAIRDKKLVRRKRA